MQPIKLTVDTVPLHVWVQLGVYVVSLVAGVATFVWFVSSLKASIERSITEVNAKVDLVQHTVSPYASDIAQLKSQVSAIKQCTAKTEARTEMHTRDIDRLEGLIDRIRST